MSLPNRGDSPLYRAAGAGCYLGETFGQTPTDTIIVNRNVVNDVAGYNGTSVPEDKQHSMIEHRKTQ